MRRKQSSSGLTVNAVAGTHVVLLGLDLSSAKRRNCLGFAVQREDYFKEGQQRFLRRRYFAGL